MDEQDSAGRGDAPDELLASWVKRISPGLALDLGAGTGEIASWLSSRGFTVDAIEQDPQAFSRLRRTAAHSRVRPQLVDLRHYVPPSRTYDLVTALAVLHFLPPSLLTPLVGRMCDALRPGGLLIATVFSTDDPGFSALRQSGAQEIEPNTYSAPDPIGLVHYFEPGELRHLFSSLTVLEYEESRRLDAEAGEGYRAGAALVASRPAGEP